MPMFYCHVRASNTYAEDLEGSEHSSLDAARRDAVMGAKHIIGEAIRNGIPLSSALARTIEIADDRGQKVLTIPFAEAAEIDTRVS